jgi:hypothetical protein
MSANIPTIWARLRNKKYVQLHPSQLAEGYYGNGNRPKAVIFCEGHCWMTWNEHPYRHFAIWVRKP